jgi:hypothetical protein
MYKFPSLANDKIAYAWHYEWVMNGHNGISPYAKQYETYGDGLTQHSPLRPVQIEQIVDFLYSLAQYLKETPELAENISGWKPSIASKDIEFCKSLVYKEGKDKYYNLKERKVSSSDSKRFDKRWERIHSWANGSIMSTYRLLVQEHEDTIQRLCTLCHICNWFAANEEYVWINPKDYGYEHVAEPGEWQKLYNAFTAVNNYIVAARKMEMSTRLVNNYMNNIKPN